MLPVHKKVLFDNIIIADENYFKNYPLNNGLKKRKMRKYVV